MTTESLPAPALTAPAAAVVDRRPRLWPAVVLVALFWVAFVVVGNLDKYYFTGFLYGMASAAVLVLLYSIWWWCNRQLALAERVWGCLLVLATGLAVAPFCHWSILFGLATLGLPLALTVLTLWTIVVHRTGFARRRLGLFLVLLVAWGYFALIRVDGLNADLEAKIRWRWTPTAEDKFLAKMAHEGNASPSPASPVRVTLSAGDWPAFRGPDRDGVIANVRIASDWDTAPPKRLWHQEVGPGWSSVIVIGERLFTQEQRGPDETVVCYEASTGKQLWVHGDRARFEDTVSGAGPRATPTFADGRLFTLGATGLVNCLDAATGKRLWSHDVVAEFDGAPPMWGYASSPLVVGDTVIVFAGGSGDRNLLAYRTDTGELAWAAAASHGSYSSPQLVTLNGRRQCLLLGDCGLTAVDPDTGSVLWRHGWAQAGAPRTVQAHVLGPSRLLAGTLTGPGVGLVDVTCVDGRWEVAEVWSTTQVKPEFPDFVVHQGYAYGFDGAFFCCFDLANGKRRWKEGRYGRGQVLLLPEQALLLVTSEQGEALLLAADPQQHRELGRFQALAEKTWNHPVLAHGRLYLRNAEEIGLL